MVKMALTANPETSLEHLVSMAKMVKMALTVSMAKMVKMDLTDFLAKMAC
jgi:hypothetical protein